MVGSAILDGPCNRAFEQHLN